MLATVTPVASVSYRKAAGSRPPGDMVDFQDVSTAFHGKLFRGYMFLLLTGNRYRLKNLRDSSDDFLNLTRNSLQRVYRTRNALTKATTVRVIAKIQCFLRSFDNN